MNDQTQTDFNVTSGPAGTDVSAGAQLQAARMAAGLTLDDLSGMLKVSVKKLEALEANRPDLLPDVVFARALAASVCRILKIDPALVLAQLPALSGHPVIPTSDTVEHDAATDHTGDGAWYALTTQLPKSILAGLLVLVVGIVVMLLWPHHPDGMDAVEAVEPDRVATDDVPNAADVNNTGVTGSIGDTPHEAEGDSAQILAPQAVLPASAPMLSASVAFVSAPVSAPPKVLSPVRAASVPLPTSSMAAGILGLHAQGPSWVEVTDAAGAVLLSRILAEGEQIAVSGTVPLSVVVGRSDAVSVTVRGRPLDVAAWSNGSVARFQVK